jgi:acyl-coenzyme A synthetase/AMP-(fatty) acid ligase
VDPDGYFWFVGRDDDVINTGGHLVGPFEVESALLEHPAVAESAAVAKPDPVNMEVVKAFVALKPSWRRFRGTGAARSSAGSSARRSGANRSATFRP